MAAGAAGIAQFSRDTMKEDSTRSVGMAHQRPNGIAYQLRQRLGSVICWRR